MKLEGHSWAKLGLISLGAPEKLGAEGPSCWCFRKVAAAGKGNLVGGQAAARIQVREGGCLKGGGSNENGEVFRIRS